MRISGIIIICVLTISACSGNKPEKLPILGSREPVEKVVDGKTIIDTVYQTIPNFSFVDQDSVIINNDSLKGKIYVADFFFTSCPSICPIMSKNLLTVYQKYKGNPEVAIVSHTIDPKHDTIPVLKKYAEKLGVNDNQWHFLLGAQDTVYQLAKDGYLSFAAEDSTVSGGITHSGYFILVDKQQHIRGAYDGTDETQVKKLLSDMDILLNEDKDPAK